MLKVCLVGVGGISGAHIPAWEKMEDAELTAICDIREERLALYPEKRHYTDFDEMLEKEKPDILDICLPTYLHADFAVKALEKGIHVLCEKPISLKPEDVERVYRTAHEHHVNFMIAHVLRFWPEYEFIKELIDTQKFGKILSGQMTRISAIPAWSWDGWMQDEKRSGFVPFDLHIHDLDFLVYALGAPEQVRSSRIKRPEQDSFSVIYDFDGVFVSCDSAWYAGRLPFRAGYRFQFEKALVIYEDGVLKLYDDAGNVLNLSEAGESDNAEITIPKSDAYANEINYFADCVRKGVFPDKVKPEELSCVMDILLNLK